MDDRPLLQRVLGNSSRQQKADSSVGADPVGLGLVEKVFLFASNLLFAYTSPHCGPPHHHQDRLRVAFPYDAYQPADKQHGGNESGGLKNTTMENLMKRQSPQKQCTKTLRSPSDHCFPSPGEYLTVNCGVCGMGMTVKRNVLGATGFVEAMAIQAGQTKGHLHDKFVCKDREKSWHQQARAIRKMASESPSKRLADLLTEEADEIVRTRKATKKL